MIEHPHDPTRASRPSTSRPPVDPPHRGRSDAGADLARERGQATAEYALVLLGAAAVALMLAAWAARSGALGELFDSVVGQLIDKAR